MPAKWVNLRWSWSIPSTASKPLAEASAGSCSVTETSAAVAPPVKAPVSLLAELPQSALSQVASLSPTVVGSTTLTRVALM